MAWQEWAPRIGEPAAKQRRFVTPLWFVTFLSAFASAALFACQAQIPDLGRAVGVCAAVHVLASAGVAASGLANVVRRELAAHEVARALSVANGGIPVIVPARVLGHTTAFDMWSETSGLRWVNPATG